MTHEDAGHYAAKHPTGTELNQAVAEAIKQKGAVDNIACATAHAIAGNLDILPGDVAVTLDLMEVRINKCQMGLFGYKPEKKIVVPTDSILPELETAIKKKSVNNRLTCLECWEIAEMLEIKKMDVSTACETLDIKIGTCQIGAFK
jgi:hypothetical protein